MKSTLLDKNGNKVLETDGVHDNDEKTIKKYSTSLSKDKKNSMWDDNVDSQDGVNKLELIKVGQSEKIIWEKG